MRRTRTLSALGLLVAAVALLSAPVTAQSVNRAVIDDLNEQLLYVALPLMLFVELTLLNAIYRFRNNDDPTPTADDRALEITWNVATAVILVFVGISAYFVMTNPYLTPAAASPGEDAPDVEIEVTAYQWGWEFHYPEANVTTTSRLVIPEGRDVQFNLTSEDVIHAIYVPDLGIKQDIFPGKRQIARTRATETGEYRLYCAEFCGDGHARMQATVDVRNASEYREWLDSR